MTSVDFCSVFLSFVTQQKESGVVFMEKSLQKNLEALYELCDKAESLPMSAKSSYGTYRQALKTEIEGVLGYLLLQTDLDEKQTVEFTRDCLDERITAAVMKRLPNEYPLKSNLKRYTLELLEFFITLDNRMHDNDSDYKTSVAHFLYLLLFQVLAALFKTLTKVSDKAVETADTLLKNMQRHVIQSVKFSVSPSELTLKERMKQLRQEEDDEEEEEEEDTVEQTPEVTETLEELLAQLQALTGLSAVKKDVSSMINMLKIQQIRQQRGMKSTPMSLHMVFYGNPGTGKTTVARLIAKIYYRLGVLSKGHLIETDRAGLVGSYVGHTALKVKKVVKQALGGILFIDEAYTLTRNQGGNDFGQEAVDTLLKCMEDRRSDLIVIVAGYPELMTQFIASNPGLQSRFNKYINFVDYRPEELLSIFESMCQQQGYRLSEKAKVFAKNYFVRLYENRDENFANGRDVRNYFEKAIARQANRLAQRSNWTNDQLARLEVSDLSDELAEAHEEERRQEQQSAARPIVFGGRELHPGERAEIADDTNKKLEIRLMYERLDSGIELDGYAFLLAKNGRVLSDNDLIFFGQEESEDGSVTAGGLSDYPTIQLCLSKVSAAYEKISVCFSAYGDDERLNFTRVTKPVIRVLCDGKERYWLALNRLSQEKCLVGLEFYRNKGVWKLKAVGAGYNGKLRTLCESFGVTIE